MDRPARLILFSLGALLIVVALGAPHGFVSTVELCGGAVLIGCALLLLLPGRKKGIALKDLPWIKARKTGNGSDPKTGA